MLSKKRIGILVVILALTLLFSMTACTEDTSDTASNTSDTTSDTIDKDDTDNTQTTPDPQQNRVGFDEEFFLANQPYKLHRIVEITEDSTDETTWYGIDIYTEDSTAPTPSDGGSDIRNILNIKLDGESETFETAIISFGAVNDAGNYKGIIRFIFLLPKDVEFPQYGELSNLETNETVLLDLSDFDIEKTTVE